MSKARQIETSIDEARKNKDWATALSHVKRYAKVNANGSSILEDIILAESLLEKDPSQSKTVLSKVLSKEPSNEDALSLYGKLLFQDSNYSDAISNLTKINPRDALQYSPHGLRLTIESLFYLGQSYEKTHQLQDAISAYTKGSSLGLTYMETQPLGEGDAKSLTEQSLLRCAQLYLQMGNVPKCLETLRKAQSPSLGGLSPSNQNPFNKQMGRTLLRNVTAAEYRMEGVTQDEVEEALFCLLSYEDSVGARDSDFTLFDDLCLLYTKRFGYSNTVELLERVIKFEDKHSWLQLSLSLMSSGNSRRALFVIKQCLSLDPNNTLLYLMAAKICLNDLGEIQQATQFAQSAVKLEGGNLAKSLHALGLAYSKQSTQVKSAEERKNLQIKALEYLQKSFDLDSEDYLVSYHLSLQYAEVREVTKALHYIKISLSLNNTQADAWNLLSLLFSSQKQYADALLTCKAGLLEVTDINLLVTRAKLEQILGNPNQALMTLKEAFVLWKKMDQFEKKIQKQNENAFKIESDRKSMESSVKDFDTESLDRKSVIYTHTMSVYSDPADNERREFKAATGRIDLWMATADIFCELGQYKDAQTCVQEAKNISNLSPQVFFQEGHIFELKQSYTEAMEGYEKALAIDSSHIQSLIQLAILYHKQGKLMLAEKALHNVVRHDPTCHEAWYHLGRVLHTKEQYEEASECFVTSIELEETAPLIPYSKLKKTFNWA